MTDLTEQWKKGELINGKKYYITFFDSEPFEATFRTFEAMFPYWKFEANGRQYCNENGYECIKVLAPVPSYDDWMATRGTAQFLMDKNKQLKELLKECQSKLNYCTRETYELQTKINQALGEEEWIDLNLDFGTN